MNILVLDQPFFFINNREVSYIDGWIQTNLSRVYSTDDFFF